MSTSSSSVLRSKETMVKTQPSDIICPCGGKLFTNSQKRRPILEDGIFDVLEDVDSSDGLMLVKNRDVQFVESLNVML
ncbi:hypothetical protein HanPI659440_Chr05g0204101 [Helianthus annuus]|nr:hypothetical protein HanLR1_Chr05g0183031 [Helianthus annuus]KAJ0789487.1 hypothetical protein HanPI659440_Chr05g0204101 [Helianthus annuus]